MEEDLKCFEEEIRISGYSNLLEKVRIERKRQKEQVKNKKRQESLINGEFEEYSREENEETIAETREKDKDKDKDSSSEKEQQQQQQQQRKRRPANRNASNPKKSRASAVDATKKTIKPDASTAESDDEAQLIKITRAERLLRRNKPNYVGKETSETTNPEEGDDEEGEGEGEEGETKEEEDNQGDDEAEAESESEKFHDFEVSEDENINYNDNETENVKDDPKESLDLQSSRSTRRQSKPSPSSSNEQVYCTCNRVSFGEMIGCDAKDCPVEWFHYECVGLKSPPKGKWYCKGCQETMDAKTAAQFAVGISTRSSRRSG